MYLKFQTKIKIKLNLFKRRATDLFPVFHGGQMKRWKGVVYE